MYNFLFPLDALVTLAGESDILRATNASQIVSTYTDTLTDIGKPRNI